MGGRKRPQRRRSRGPGAGVPAGGTLGELRGALGHGRCCSDETKPPGRDAGQPPARPGPGASLRPEESALWTERRWDRTPAASSPLPGSAPDPPSLHSDGCRDGAVTPHSPPLRLVSLRTQRCPFLRVLCPHAAAFPAHGSEPLSPSQAAPVDTFRLPHGSANPDQEAEEHQYRLVRSGRCPSG